MLELSRTYTGILGIERELDRYTKIEKGLIQGYIFSADIFNLYSEVLLRLLETLPFLIGGRILSNIRNADDSVAEGRQRKTNPRCELRIRDVNMRQGQTFQNLRSVLKGNEKCVAACLEEDFSIQNHAEGNRKPLHSLPRSQQNSRHIMKINIWRVLVAYIFKTQGI